MRYSGLWRDHRRILAHVAILGIGCGLAVWARTLVAAETMDDLPAVALQAGVLTGLVGAAALAARSASLARTLAERVTLRLVPIAFVLVAAVFVTTSYVDVSVSLHDLLSPADTSQTSVVLGPGGHDIRLSGELIEGSAQRLADLLEAHPEVARIHLTSEGGLVDEGDALRKVIATRHLTTFVPDYCVSACTLAFLGGHERLVMEGARVGFHAPFEEGLFGQQFLGESGSERGLYLAAGVAADFVDTALDVAPADLWTPGADQLIAAHVATGVVGRYRFPDSNLDGMATLSGARATLLRNFPATRALDARTPRDIDRMAAWYLAAYRAGLSEGQVVDQLTVLVRRATTLKVAGAKS